MASHQTLLYLKYAHGSFGFLLLLAVCYQAWNGLRVRTARLKEAPPPAAAVKAHRKLGSLLALLGPIAFLAGLSTAAVDKGILEYPPHLIAGTVLMAFLAAAYSASHAIRGAAERQRNVHALLGLIVLCLWLIQAFIGLGVLL